MGIEEWRPLSGSDGRFEVSSWGRVHSLRRDGTIKQVLNGAKNRHGYIRVQAKALNQRRLWFIHQLVAMAFIGDCPKGHMVNHIDNDPSNNYWSNLEYVTARGNQQHSWRTTSRKPPHQGEQTHFAKLTESDVKQIRAMRKEGFTYSKIASHFNTKPANVWFICIGRTWKHVIG